MCEGQMREGLVVTRGKGFSYQVLSTGITWPHLCAGKFHSLGDGVQAEMIRLVTS